MSVAASSVAEGHAQPVLMRLREPEISLAIWHRKRPHGIASWLDALSPEQLPEGRLVGPAACIPARLTALCSHAGLADSPARQDLVADISFLALAFANLAGAREIDLRLEAIDHNACWRFHRDHVGLRLNATYRGPGTQWLPPEHAKRALKAQHRYSGPLNEMPAFAVGVFKGVTRAGEAAVVHRSPPVEGTGQTRLFLCLTEVADEG